MKVWGAIFNIIAVLIIITITMSMSQFIRISRRDFDQERLNISVTYATEAMFRESLKVQDIGLDYFHEDMIDISPGNSLDTFLELMSINYGLSNSQENSELLLNNINALILLDSSGFYTLQLVQDDTTPQDNIMGREFAFRWSVKIPYMKTVGNTTVALSTGREGWASITTGGTILAQEGEDNPLGLTDLQINSTIREQIKENIIAEASKRELDTGIFDNLITIPFTQTITGVNPLDPPGILLLMSGGGYASVDDISAVSVSGFKVRERNNIVGFIENSSGRRYYAKQGQLDPGRINIPGPSGYMILDYFNNMREAAEAGFFPHIGILRRKVR